MHDWRQITHDAKDILTVCLAKAIDQAMTVRSGPNWFSAFAENDAKEKVNIRITKPGQRSMQDMDLQALLKFLRFRSNLTEQVLAHYGFFENLDALASDDQRRQLNALLDRLINDFRNRIEAHSRAADIEKELSGQGIQRIYGYEEAYQDMYKLTKIFSNVTDSNGVAYYQQMASLVNRKQSRQSFLLFLAIALILTAGFLLWRLPHRSGNRPQIQNPSAIQHDQAAIQVNKLYYKGDRLIAECHIVNGTGRTISNINVYSFCLSDDIQDFAAADFGFLQGIELAPGESTSWQFIFPKQTVFAYDADLSQAKANILFCYD